MSYKFSECGKPMGCNVLADQMDKNLYRENYVVFTKSRQTYRNFTSPALKHCGVT